MAKQEYNEELRSKAGKKAVLRALVAGYLVYLGWNIATGESSSMSQLTARLIGGVFIAAAAAFGVYIFRSWRSDLAAAQKGEKTEGDELCDDE